MSLHGSWPNRDVWRSSNVASPPAAVFCILFHGLLGDFLFCKQFILPSMFPLEGAFCWRVSCSFPSYTQLCLLRHASATVHAENYISEISGLKKKKEIRGIFLTYAGAMSCFPAMVTCTDGGTKIIRRGIDQCRKCPTSWSARDGVTVLLPARLPLSCVRSRCT